MKAVTLNGRKMKTVETTHEYIQRKLNLPEYYGANLDALWDILSTASEPLTIGITNSDKLYEHLGGYGHALVQVFLDAERDNSNVSVEISDPPNYNPVP